MPVATKGTATVTLPSDTEILITREFAGSRRNVWRAWTEPDLVRQWWFGDHEMTTCEIDLRVGGSYRYVMTLPDHEVGFHGEFREIAAPERIVNTEIYEGVPAPYPGEEVLNYVTFTESDGRTRLELLVACPSQEVRDAILDSGMETGMQEQMDTLDALVATLN
jgi:uncharacterized protein YndB with AHSA1/START domain